MDRAKWTTLTETDLGPQGAAVAGAGAGDRVQGYLAHKKHPPPGTLQ